MSAVSLELRNTVFEAGYSAAEQSKLRASAICPIFKSLMPQFRGNKVMLDMLDEWIAGYDSRIDEEVAEKFADDPYFAKTVVRNKQLREARRLAHSE